MVVTAVIEKREALLGEVAVSDDYSVISVCDILDEENYQEAECTVVQGRMPRAEDEVLIAEIVYEYMGRFVDLEIGQPLKLTVEQKTVQVILAGTFDTRKVTNGHGNLATDCTQVFLCRELVEELFPEIEDFDYSWNIVSESQKVQSVETGLRDVIASYKDVSLETFTELLEYGETQNRIMFGSMQALSWLVFLFGVINLINTPLSNQTSRKRENSILRSIGLTPEQLCKMNICEGCAMRSLRPRRLWLSGSRLRLWFAGK